MKLPFNFTFSDNEKKLLKWVGIGSASACLLIIIVTWVVSYFVIHKPQKKESASESKTLVEFYQSNAKSLLPIDIKVHTWAAEQLLKTNESQQAIEHLLRILPADRENRYLRLLLSKAYINTYQFAEAREQLSLLMEDKIADSLTESIESLYGLALFHNGDIDGARKILIQCLRKHSHSAEAACYLGQIEASIDKHSKRAEDYFKQATQLDPLYTEAWYQLARYYMARNMLKKCRAHLLHVLDLEPLHFKAHSRLGMTYYYLKEYDMAEKSYSIALTINPDDYNTRYNLGELYYTLYEVYRNRAHKFSEYERDVSRFTTLNKEAEKNKALAAKEYKTALAIKSDHSLANYKLGIICISNAQYREAAYYLNKAIDNEPQNITYLLQLGVAYEKMSQMQKALETYQRIASFDELNPIARQKIKMLTRSL